MFVLLVQHVRFSSDVANTRMFLLIPDQVLFQLFLIHYATTNTFACSIVPSSCNTPSSDSFVPATEVALNRFIPLLANQSSLDFYIDGSFNPDNSSLPGIGFTWIQPSFGYSYEGFVSIPSS